jgi:hypothetical protein
MENLNPKCDQTNIKFVKFSNLKMKMRLRIKIFPSKLYPFHIDVYFKHQNTLCTLLKIVYIIQVWKLGFS